MCRKRGLWTSGRQARDDVLDEEIEEEGRGVKFHAQGYLLKLLIRIKKVNNASKLKKVLIKLIK